MIHEAFQYLLGPPGHIINVSYVTGLKGVGLREKKVQGIELNLC